VGSTRPEREYQSALTDYRVAADRLVRAMAAWEAARVPVLPGPDGELAPWTAHQVRVTVEAALAWRQLTVKRRELDRCGRVPGARPPARQVGEEPAY
jgi:hypothetical protein